MPHRRVEVTEKKPPFVSLAQDKGGHSKGGFLNNQLFSYTNLYLCNEINGTCILIMYYSGTNIIQETTFTRTTFVLAR